MNSLPLAPPGEALICTGKQKFCVVRYRQNRKKDKKPTVSLEGSKTLINLLRITRKANQTEFGLFMQLQTEKAQMGEGGESRQFS